MKNRYKIFYTLIASLISFTTFANSPEKLSAERPYQILGYFANWDIYGRNYHPENIPMDQLTGIVYAFAQIGNCAPPYASDEQPNLCNAGAYATGLQDYKLYSTDPYADFEIVPQGYKLAGSSGRGTINKTIQLAHAQKKPVILSIGGYTLSTSLGIAMQAQHRQAFIESILQFLNEVKQNNHGDGFDGVDIDWEPHYSDWNKTSPQETEDFVNFLTELKQALKTKYSNTAWLTIAATANPDGIKLIGKDNWQKISEAVDLINVMTYDYHGGFDHPQVTAYQSALFYDPNQPNQVTHAQDFNVDSTIQAYANVGVPTSKLILGFPSYGRAVSGVSANEPPKLPGMPGLYQSFASTPSGEWNDGTGVYDYKYIVKNMLGTGGFKEYFNSIAQADAAYNASTQTWISYDNQDLVKTKAEYVMNKGLKGMMTWELSGDFSPQDSDFKKYSLLYAASQVLQKTATK